MFCLGVHKLRKVSRGDLGFLCSLYVNTRTSATEIGLGSKSRDSYPQQESVMVFLIYISYQTVLDRLAETLTGDRCRGFRTRGILAFVGPRFG